MSYPAHPFALREAANANVARLNSSPGDYLDQHEKPSRLRGDGSGAATGDRTQGRGFGPIGQAVLRQGPGFGGDGRPDRGPAFEGRPPTRSRLKDRFPHLHWAAGQLIALAFLCAALPCAVRFMLIALAMFSPDRVPS